MRRSFDVQEARGRDPTDRCLVVHLSTELTVTLNEPARAGWPARPLPRRLRRNGGAPMGHLVAGYEALSCDCGRRMPTWLPTASWAGSRPGFSLAMST